MTDVVELIMDDHARIRRLFAALDGIARYEAQVNGGTASRLACEAWARLSRLLEVHLDAEDEICRLAVSAPGRREAAIESSFADHADIREVLGEVRLVKTGCAAWWWRVAALRAVTSRHFLGEEQHVLTALRRSAHESREVLGRQWTAFITARLRDLDGGEADRYAPAAACQS